jgi:hypothetical protein
MGEAKGVVRQTADFQSERNFENRKADRQLPRVHPAKRAPYFPIIKKGFYPPVARPAPIDRSIGRDEDIVV